MGTDTIRPKCGFWDISNQLYPIGGCFRRNGETPLVVVEIEKFSPRECGANRIGKTLDGRKIAFSDEILTSFNPDD
tara:strand:+ start:434 stop:661 length:228 start_codon:yes stop_codon:yes gene_type:complete